MKKSEIKEFVTSLNKKELKTLIELAQAQLNADLGIGDTVTLTIEYMIGDADGDTEKSCEINLENEDDLTAIEIITHILENHTEPNKGHWGFSLDESSFSKKPKDVYNLLYNQEKAPKEYEGFKITSRVLETLAYVVDSCFISETEYSFLTFEDYRLEQ